MATESAKQMRPKTKNLVDEIRNEADSLQFMQMISLSGGHVKQHKQVLELLHQHCCIGVKETQRVPLENQVNVGYTCLTVHLTHLSTNTTTRLTNIQTRSIHGRHFTPLFTALHVHLAAMHHTSSSIITKY